MRKKLKDIAAFFGKRLRREDVVVHVAIDSRKVRAGSLFFALSGEKVDGHDFLSEVSKRGAVAAVVSNEYQGEDFGLDLIATEDVKKALQDLAKEVFQRKSPFVIGVTGSVGKTTAKEFIATLLSKKFRVMKSPGSLNSQIGLPSTLLNWEGNEEICVLEMGMSQKGEIARLVDIAPPNLGVLTKVSLAHSEFFNSIEEIAEAKSEIFNSRKMERAFCHLDTKAFRCIRLLKHAKTWFHPSDEGADITLKELEPPFEESHLQETFLAAAAVALHLGMSLDEIQKASQDLETIEHRFQKIEKKSILFIDDSYNASPESMMQALSNLPSLKRKVGFLGAMKELGTFETASHFDVLEHAISTLDHLICIGNEWDIIKNKKIIKGKVVEIFNEKENAVKRLKEVARPGDVVLLKGSNSFKLWTALEEF